MSFRKAGVAFLGAVVCLSIGLGLRLWLARERVYSSPTTLRTNLAYFNAHAAPQKIPEIPSSFSAIAVQSWSGGVKVDLPIKPETPSDIDYEPMISLKANNEHEARLREGAIRLAFVASAYTPEPTNIDWGVQLPARFYNSKLQLVDYSREVKAFMPFWDGTLQFNGDFPAAGFYFVKSNLADLKPIKLRAFDARTQYPLSWGYGSSYWNNAFWYSTTLQLWRPAPFEIVINLATDPIESFTMNPAAGSEIRYPAGVIRLLALADKEINTWRTRSDATNYHTSFEFSREAAQAQAKPVSSFIFFSWPSGRDYPGDLEFYGSEGRKIEGHARGGSGRIFITVVHAPLEEVKEIRLRYYSNIYRVSFTLPELPGLPEQNRNINNLFDVQVPFILFHHEYDLQQNLGHLVQMRVNHVPLTYPNGYFPLIKTNATPGDLLQEEAGLFSNSDQYLAVDPIQNVIQAKEHPIRKAIAAIKARLGL